ncbi:MAG: tRNA (adenosine(37)-N6)-threonylcarbamoyltransferase complex dimerization subunit type 1 TsaB [Chloroflexota bacterium]
MDTSTSRAGIALYDGEVLAESVWQAGRDHGRHLMPAIQEMMGRLGVQPSHLAAVAAARGPGSFTGLRVGLAVARGLAVGLGIPAYGVGSLTLLAAGLPPMDRPIRAVLAAGRGRYATALFPPGHSMDTDPAGMNVNLDSLVRLAEERCVLVGDLDAEARARLAALGERVWVAPPALCVRRPAVLAELAWQVTSQGQLPGPDDGEPIYLARGDDAL